MAGCFKNKYNETDIEIDDSSSGHSSKYVWVFFAFSAGVYSKKIVLY